MTFQLIRCQTFDPFNKVSFEKILKEIRDKVDTAVRLRGGGRRSGRRRWEKSAAQQKHSPRVDAAGKTVLEDETVWCRQAAVAQRADETTQQVEPVRLTNSRTWPAEAKQEVKHKHDASVVLMINAS